MKDTNKFLISHRANLDGPDTAKYGENHPDSIKYVLNKTKHDVEVDLWKIDSDLFLGHDKPEYKIHKNLFLVDLPSHRIWIHAKNLEALSFCAEVFYDFNYFFHDTDDAVLTSKNWIWTYPGKKIYNKYSIAVMPERDMSNPTLNIALGWCTDFCT